MSYEGNKIAVPRLPLATAAVAGAVIVGSNITVAAGTISLTATNVNTALGQTGVVWGETPTGTQNGVNVTFTLAHTPINGSLRLLKNGIYQTSGIQYNLATNTITYVANFQPASTEPVRANYTY